MRSMQYCLQCYAELIGMGTATEDAFKKDREWDDKIIRS